MKKYYYYEKYCVNRGWAEKNCSKYFGDKGNRKEPVRRNYLKSTFAAIRNALLVTSIERDFYK